MATKWHRGCQVVICKPHAETTAHRQIRDVSRAVASTTSDWHIACFGNGRCRCRQFQGRGASCNLSHPSSPSSGFPARGRLRATRKPTGATTTRPRNRLPWKSWPSGFRWRAALHNESSPGRLPVRTPPRREGCHGAIRSPLPANFLPAGFFLAFYQLALS